MLVFSIVVGAPGKSTQIPQYIADDFYSYLHEEHVSSEPDASVRILCTQPRRVAAQGMARRVAEEYKTRLGDLVGFRVGSREGSINDSKKTSDRTVIEFVTEGLLLHRMAKFPSFLKRYDCVSDKVHVVLLRAPQKLKEFA